MHEWAVILAGGDGKRLQELSYKISGVRRQNSSAFVLVARACRPTLIIFAPETPNQVSRVPEVSARGCSRSIPI